MVRSTINNFLVMLMQFGFASSLIAVTVPNQAHAGSKYGLVNMQAIILNVQEGKDARAQLEKEISKKEKEITKEKKQLDKMNKEWKAQAALLSETARMKKQQEFQEKFMSLRNTEMSFQQQIKKKEQQATQQIAIKVQKMVEKMANDLKLEMVFESNTSGLMFLKKPVDLTDKVIAAYDKKGLSKTAKKE
jgi:outer membrane protein